MAGTLGFHQMIILWEHCAFWNTGARWWMASWYTGCSVLSASCWLPFPRPSLHRFAVHEKNLSSKGSPGACLLRPGARIGHREQTPEPALLVLPECLAEKLTSAGQSVSSRTFEPLSEVPLTKLAGGWGRKKPLWLGSTPGGTCWKIDPHQAHLPLPRTGLQSLPGSSSAH